MDRDTVYSIVRNTLENKGCPAKGVMIDVVDYDGKGYAYRLYEENLSGFSDSVREDIITYTAERAYVAQSIAGKPVAVEKVDRPDE